MMLLLLSCTVPLAPSVLAQRTCHAMPGLAIDAAGLAMMQDIVVESERSLWAAIPADQRGPGFEHIGLTGYGVIRANSFCELQSISATQATLTRIEPDISQLPEWDTTDVWDLPTRTTEMTFSLVDGEHGLRTQTDLPRALEQAAAARALRDSAHFEQAVAAFEQLQAWYPDPMIDFEVQAVRAAQAEHLALKARAPEDPAPRAPEDPAPRAPEDPAPRAPEDPALSAGSPPI